MKYIILLLLLYEGVVASLFDFSYIDEIITLLLIVCTLYKVLKEQKIVLSKMEIKILLCIILIYLIGALSVFIYQIQNNMLVQLFSGVMILKAVICYIAFRIFFAESKFNHNKIILKIVKLGLYGMAILALLDRIIHIYPEGAERFGIYSTSLFFDHPTLLAGFAINSLLISYFFTHIKDVGNKKGLFIDIISALFLVIITGRFKAIGFMILFLLIIFKEKIIKTDKKVKLINFVIPLLIVVCFASDQIQYYFFDSEESRSIMLNTSIQIATDYFPLGSGFGTFGTDISREYYSSLYKIYGISNVYGLSEEKSSYIVDSMIPAIIAELGFLGSCIYILIFYNLFKNFSIHIKQRERKIFLYLIILYVLIECVAETILMTSRGVFLFCLMAFVMNYSLQEEKFKNKDLFK